MMITEREKTWSGPVQTVKFGTQMKKNAVYSASMWIKSLGDDNQMDTFYLTVKIDYRSQVRNYRQNLILTQIVIER